MDQIPMTQAPRPRAADQSHPGSGSGSGREKSERRRKSAWWRPFRKILARLAPPLLRVLLRLLQATLRIDWINAGPLRARWAHGERAIVAFWHDRLLLMPVLAAGQPICILVSQHRDGEMASQLLAAWGVTAVRGSATRGAVGGFMRLVDAFRRGSNLAILPDGPRGPRYVAKPGVVHLAKAVGSPIFPVAYAASRVARLRSWDRMIVPLPFARVVVEIGEPLEVPAHASAEQLDRCRAELEQRLMAVTQSVESQVAA
jgi:hypothetical protein